MRRLLLTAAALLVAGPAFAQWGNAPQGSVQRPQLYGCIDQHGNAALCQFSDVHTYGDITRPFTPAAPEKKAQVVAISPNSGAPNPYPSNATPQTANATGTTAAVAATMAAVQSRTNFLCGFSVSPGSAGTAITLQVTVTGLIGGTMTWAVGAPVTAVGTTGAILTQTFNPCIPASASNTAIAVNSSALGTSGVNNDVNLWGYLQ